MVPLFWFLVVVVALLLALQLGHGLAFHDPERPLTAVTAQLFGVALSVLLSVSRPVTTPFGVPLPPKRLEAVQRARQLLARLLHRPPHVLTVVARLARPAVVIALAELAPLVAEEPVFRVLAALPPVRPPPLLTRWLPLAVGGGVRRVGRVQRARPDHQLLWLLVLVAPELVAHALAHLVPATLAGPRLAPLLGRLHRVAPHPPLEKVQAEDLPLLTAVLAARVRVVVLPLSGLDQRALVA